MKFVKATILPVLFLSLINVCCAQDENKKEIKAINNSVKQLFGSYFINQSVGFNASFTQGGIYYERRIRGNIFIGAGYMQWVAPKLFTSVDKPFIKEDPVELPYKPVIGKLEYRKAYKMTDLYAFYKFHLGHNRHYINAGAGVSYCWGMNGHLKYFIQGTPTDAQVTYEWRKEDYWGFIPLVSYDYLLFKNVMNIGIDLKTRCYTDRPKIQHDYGIHIGVNF